MYQLLNPIYEFLASTPINFWVLLTIFAAPILVFILKPERKNWQLALRLVIAGAVTYVFLFLALGTEHERSWNNYQECYASRTDLRDMSPERMAACYHHLEHQLVNDSTMVFALLFGWVPAVGYVGLCESLWRTIHRKRFNRRTHRWQILWFSNLVILSALPLLYFIGLIMRLALMALADQF